MVHSNLSLCQYVKTPSFFFIMLLIVSAKTALHLVDSTGTLSQNLLLWMMKGGCGGSISRCEVHRFLALHSLFSSRICKIKVPFFGERQDTEEGFLQLFFVINKFKKSCIKSCLNTIKPFLHSLPPYSYTEILAEQAKPLNVCRMHPCVAKHTRCQIHSEM